MLGPDEFPQHRNHEIPGRSPRSIGAASGFTLVELTVSIGIVLVLMGILAPSVGRSLASSRMTRDLGQIQQCVSLLGAYANDHRDTYPVAHANAFRASDIWYDELVSSGYISSPREADPPAFDRNGAVTLKLSVCLVYSPEHMLPGRTLAPAAALSTGVRQTSVPYPTSKGAMVKWYSGEGTVNEGAHWFCCVERWRAPVAFCDGSGIITDFLDLARGRPPLIVDGIGAPVWSTWGGYLARDR